MAKKTINLGTGELTGDGESIRSAFDKINDNFDALFSAELDLSAIAQSILPDEDTAYDIGSASNRFRDIYLSGDTVDLGGLIISNADGELQLDGVKVITQSELDSTIASTLATTQANFATNISAVNVNDLANIDAPNPAIGEVLKWDGTAWTNQPDSFIEGGELTDSTFAEVSVSGDYNDLKNLPTLSTVSATGDYNDLLNLPFIPTNLSHLIINSDTDFGSNKILYSNVYMELEDLPSAATYHGMFAHVHGTGRAYYAHAGEWVELANAAEQFTASSDLTAGSPVMIKSDGTVEAIGASATSANYSVYSSTITGNKDNDAAITTYAVDPFNLDKQLISLNNLLYFVIESNSAFTKSDSISLPIGGTPKILFDKNNENKILAATAAGSDIYLTIGTISGVIISWGTPVLVSDEGGYIELAQLNLAPSKFVLQNGNFVRTVTPDYITDTISLGTAESFPTGSNISNFDVDPFDPTLIFAVWGSTSGDLCQATVQSGKIIGDVIDFSGTIPENIINIDRGPGRPTSPGNVFLRCTGEQPGKFVVSMIELDRSSYESQDWVSVAIGILEDYDTGDYSVGQTYTPFGYDRNVPQINKTNLFVNTVSGTDFVVVRSEPYRAYTTHRWGHGRINNLEIEFVTGGGAYAFSDRSRHFPMVAWRPDDSGVFYKTDEQNPVGETFLFRTTVTRSEVSIVTSNIRPEDVIGISNETVTAGDSVLVNLAGSIDNNQSGLTAGTDYYITDDGELTETASLTNYNIGIAVSPTELLVKPVQPARISYGDLKDKPLIPTDIANLTDIGGLLSSGDYDDLTNKPTIPSELTDLNISDGTDGQVLKTDGTGTFEFESLGSLMADYGGLSASPDDFETEISTVSISDLADVSAASPTTGEVLKWNGSLWTAQADDSPTALSDLTNDLDYAGIVGTTIQNNGLPVNTFMTGDLDAQDNDISNANLVDATLSGTGPVSFNNDFLEDGFRGGFTTDKSILQINGAEYLNGGDDGGGIYIAGGTARNGGNNGDVIIASGVGGADGTGFISLLSNYITAAGTWIGTQTMDIKGSVFGDDSTPLVDGVNNKITGRVETPVIIADIITPYDGTESGTGSNISISGGNGETAGGTFIAAGGVGVSGEGGSASIGGGPGSAGKGGDVFAVGGSGSTDGGDGYFGGGTGSTGAGGAAYISGGTGGSLAGGEVTVIGGSSSLGDGGEVTVSGGDTNTGTPGDVRIRGGKNNADTAHGTVYIGDDNTDSISIGESEKIVSIGIGQHNVNNTTTTNLYGDIVFQGRDVLFSGSDITFENEGGLNTASIDFSNVTVTGLRFVNRSTFTTNTTVTSGSANLLNFDAHQGQQAFDGEFETFPGQWTVDSTGLYRIDFVLGLTQSEIDLPLIVFLYNVSGSSNQITLHSGDYTGTVTSMSGTTYLTAGQRYQLGIIQSSGDDIILDKDLTSIGIEQLT